MNARVIDKYIITNITMNDLQFISEEKRSTIATYLSEISKISKNIDALSVWKLYISVDSETPAEDETFAWYVDTSLLISENGDIDISKLLEIIDIIYGENYVWDRLYYRIEDFEGSNIYSDWHYVGNDE